MILYLVIALIIFIVVTENKESLEEDPGILLSLFFLLYFLPLLTIYPTPYKPDVVVEIQGFLSLFISPLLLVPFIPDSEEHGKWMGRVIYTTFFLLLIYDFFGGLRVKALSEFITLLGLMALKALSIIAIIILLKSLIASEAH